MSGLVTTPENQALLRGAYVRARAALAGLARGDAAPTGLGDEERAAARVLDAAPRTGGGLRLDVASDGLDLAGKAAVEGALKAALGAGPDELAVYFKKRESAPVGPAPRTSAKSAFGVVRDVRAIPGVAEVIVVASGKGGVGKSTVSVNLAVAMARAGRRVGLLDADIYGPSAPLMMGLAGRKPEVRGEMLAPLEAHGVKVASFGFLAGDDEPAIWRGPLVAKAFKQLAYDVAWGELDALIVDLPPGTGDVQLALVESLPIARAVIVTTPQDVALIDAKKALAMFQRLSVPVAGIVENMAHFHCPSCGHEEALFGEGGGARLAAAQGLPVLAKIPLARVVRERGDGGMPVATTEDAPGAAAFHALAAQLTPRVAQQSPFARRRD